MTDAPRPPSRRENLARWWQAQPTWTRVLLGLSVAAVVVGGVLTLAGGPTTAAPANAPVGTGPGSTLVPGRPSGTQTPVADRSTSAGVFRLGFSFVAGLCLGTFLRTMARLAAIAVGFWLFMTIVLASFDVVTVNWEAIDQAWDRFWSGVQWDDFEQFLTGSLPAAGLASAGLYAGLRRRR